MSTVQVKQWQQRQLGSTVQSQQNACDSLFYLRTTFLMNTKVCTCPNAKQFG